MSAYRYLVIRTVWLLDADSNRLAQREMQRWVVKAPDSLLDGPPADAAPWDWRYRPSEWPPLPDGAMWQMREELIPLGGRS